MTSSDEPVDDVRAAETVHVGRAAADPAAVRRLVDQLHRSITKTFDDWGAGNDATLEGSQHEAAAFARPVTVAPVRMEQLARAPEPTADLDDLVDLLVPRLLEKLVPALRRALRDDDDRV